MTTSPFSDPAHADDLLVALLAPDAGLTLQGPVLLQSSGPSAAWLYDGSLNLGIGSGVLLTTGTVPGTANTVGWFGQDNGADGHPDIHAVVNTVFQTVSYDATMLAFDVTAAAGATSISFDLVFGSEEYPEWVDQFVDCAVVMVNGVNQALFDHDPSRPLSVIGPNLTAGYFQDNAAHALPIEYDGVSRVLKIVVPILEGEVNHIAIGIADTGDHIYDSGIFIANLRAGHTPGSGVVSSPGGCTEGDDQVVGTVQGEFYDLAGGHDVAYAGGGDDILLGGTGNDRLFGGSGADVLEGDAGDDWIDGGADIDTAVYMGLHDAYTLGFDGVVTTVLSTYEGMDSLVGVEQLRFADGLYALAGDTLTLLVPELPASSNSTGWVNVVGVGTVGSVLTALLSDPDGVAIDTVTWQWYADGVPIADAQASTYTVTEADSGADLSVVVNYLDGASHAESVESMAKVIAATDDGDFQIEMMVLAAPTGASTMNPLTTLMARLVETGVTPAEAALMLRDVWVIDNSVDVRTYDAWAILHDVPADLVARSVESLCVQIAVLCAAGGDQTGMALAQAVALAYQSQTTLDLADPTFIATQIDPDLQAAAYQEVCDRNANLVETVGRSDPVAFLEGEWLDFQSGLAVTLSSTVADLSVHINQAPTGMAVSTFTSVAGHARTFSIADLVAGFVDADGGTLLAQDVMADQGGTCVINEQGDWTFVSASDYAGPVELSWLVTDGQGGTAQASAMLVVEPLQVIEGSSDDDQLMAALGHIQVHAGAGTDTVWLPLFPDAFAWDVGSNDSVSGVYGPGYLIELQQVEQVQFGFGAYQTTLALTELLSGHAKEQLGALTDLYLAFFGRAPDVEGLAYWQRQLLDQGLTDSHLNKDFAQIAKDFAWSVEAQALYPLDAGNRDFVQIVYQNCFGRDPDSGGWDYWTGRLDGLGHTDLSDRGAFVAEVILGAYAITSGDEDRSLLTNRHDVALYYANALFQQPEEGFDSAINDLLVRVNMDAVTADQARQVIDHVFHDDAVTLTGIMSNPTLWDTVWGG